MAQTFTKWIELLVPIRFFLTRRKDLLSNPWFWSWYLMPIRPAAMWGTTWLVTRPFATYRRQRVASTNSLRTLDSRDLEEMGYMDVWAIMGTIFPLLVCLAAPCFPHHLFIILTHVLDTPVSQPQETRGQSWTSLETLWAYISLGNSLCGMNANHPIGLKLQCKWVTGSRFSRWKGFCRNLVFERKTFVL